MSNRANSSNSNGTTQTQAGNVVPLNTWVTTFPRPSGQTITVTRLNGEMSAAGAAVGDLVERDSDGGFWDTTVGVRVPPDFTSLQLGNDMISN
jgi:hypothetical protein